MFTYYLDLCKFTENKIQNTDNLLVDKIEKAWYNNKAVGRRQNQENVFGLWKTSLQKFF